jgi:glycosyltransferase involved in cell wall biosynthesis
MSILKPKKLKITIITVTYNSEKTIKTALNSVKDQTYKKIEHIIIDGNSADKTVSIFKQYSYLNKIISEPDAGIYDAMNKGINIATGDIICFLNSDDFYVKDNVLSRVIDVFEDNPSLEACYADLIYVDQIDISKKKRYWKSSKFIPGLFAKGWCPPHPTFFALRSVYARFGIFNLDYRLASDNEIMMRFLEVHKINVQYIPEVWIKMRLGGITNKNLKNLFLQNVEIFRALRKNGLSSNPISFFFHKIILRLRQRLHRFEYE